MLNLVSAGLSLAQGFLGARSAKAAGKAKAKQARAMAAYNASVKNMEAKSIAQSMDYETSQAYKQKRRALSETQTAIVKSGAQMSGTTMDVMLESASNMQMDILNARRNRQLQIDTKKQQSKAIKWEGEIQARQARFEAKQAAQSSLLSGFSGAMTSGFKAYEAGEFGKIKSFFSPKKSSGYKGDINIGQAGMMT
tara:strand:- start:1003 stop:1587 length:585 start_codon:yes stop_codon:yes gene_type:complete